nr:phage portal protein [Roseomonas rosulenta]
MPFGLDRIFRRSAPALRTRGFEGAAMGRRWGDSPRFGRIESETGLALPTLRARSRHSAQNSPWASNGLHAIEAAAVGTGIVPASAHPDQATRRALGEAFAVWTAQADAEGRLDFYGQTAAVARAIAVDGEALVQIVETRDGLRLRHLPAELLAHDETRDGLPGGGYLVSGVEFNAAGERVAYMVHRDRAAFGMLAPARVPSEMILHIFRPVAAGQVRGIPWLTPALLRLRDEDQTEDALLMAAKVAALHAGFLIDQNATGPSPFTSADGDQRGTLLEAGLEPGTLRVLPAGFDIRFSSPQQMQQAVEFLGLQLRAIAAGLGVPEYLLTGDLRQANYSSLRASLVEFRRRIEAFQHLVLIRQFVRPVWERFIAHAVLRGAIDAPGFDDDPRPYMAAEFYPPAWPWVDPMKDAEAEAALIATGLKSRRQAVAERGYSVEQLDAEIAADRKRETALGLAFGAAPATTTEPAPDA